MKTNRRAIFLGSFNPPHQGHVNCIKSVIESNIIGQLNIDKIHVIPCWQNPNKSKSIDFYDRYKMCKCEFASLSDNCLVDDIEASLKPTYTYELIDYFKKNKDQIINSDFWWIVTEETIEELIDNKWKESERLLKENKFIILYSNERHCVSSKVNNYFKEIDKSHDDYQCIPLIGQIDAHSTQIRNNFWLNTKYDNCITKDTKEYIIEHNLYKNTNI